MARNEILKLPTRRRFWACVAMVGILVLVVFLRSQKPSTVTLNPPPTGETLVRVYLTGYSYWDNTPPQSAIIARPVLHKKAGGTGTFEDPVTLAVGHRKEDGEFFPDYPPGTRFYLPVLQKYAMVEDLCGDGDTPQLGPCHIGYRGHAWVDLYVGGADHDADEAEACTRKITGLQPAIVNPAPHYPSEPGEVLATHCAADQEVSELTPPRPASVEGQKPSTVTPRR